MTGDRSWPWRGVFAIPVTPFHADLSVDPKGLVGQVEFCLASGVHGLVYPGVVSEFFTLSESERVAAVRTVISTAAGAVPVVVGVSAPSAPVAAGLAAGAAEAGAAGVMATLPYVAHFFSATPEDMVGYYDRISAACGLPIVLQNARIGSTVPRSLLPELVRAVPGVRYVKEEANPGTHKLTETITALGSAVDGVFAGLGGIHLINELDRGAVGSMPSPSLVDRVVRVYDAYRSGARDTARTELGALGSLFNLELLYNVSVIKEILRRRGVIASAICRAPAPLLDDVDRTELTELLDLAGVPVPAKSVR